MAKFDAPPVRTPFFGKEQDGTPAWTWKKWLQAIAPAITPPNAQTAPTQATSAASKSGFSCDDNFLYVVTPSGLWKKIALSAL